MEKFRIKKITYKDNTERFIIQYGIRLFSFFGPYMWSYYHQNNIFGGYKWTNFIEDASVYYTLDAAKEQLQEIKNRKLHNTIDKEEVIDENC